MFREARPFLMLCETPLHAGTGSDLGLVDLPIQREKPTGYPKVESSSLKGCLREEFERLKFNSAPWQAVQTKLRRQNLSEEQMREAVKLAFGAEDAVHAGALGFSDARLLLFPVKSMKGVFVWITCQAVLSRWKTDFDLGGVRLEEEIPATRQNALIPQAPKLSPLSVSGKIVLEEFAFEAEESLPCARIAAQLADWLFPSADPNQKYFHDKLKTSLVILPDNDFRDFITLSTEVITRTKINSQTGTVENTGLFTEEYLPTDSILYSLALAAPLFHVKDQKLGIFADTPKSDQAEALLNFFAAGLPEVVQLGGNASLGKGLLRIRQVPAQTTSPNLGGASHD